MFFYDNFSIKFHINIIAKSQVNWNIIPCVERSWSHWRMIVKLAAKALVPMISFTKAKLWEDAKISCYAEERTRDDGKSKRPCGEHIRRDVVFYFYTGAGKRVSYRRSARALQSPQC